MFKINILIGCYSLLIAILSALLFEFIIGFFFEVCQSFSYEHSQTSSLFLKCRETVTAYLFPHFLQKYLSLFAISFSNLSKVLLEDNPKKFRPCHIGICPLSDFQEKVVNFLTEGS